jgi:hypothetical protein
MPSFSALGFVLPSCHYLVQIEEVVESDTGDFLVKFKILEFQKRMRVSNQVQLEFIARGKIINIIETFWGEI